VVLICITILPFTTVNFIVDPEQYFRKSRFYTVIFDENERFQNPGLAKHYNYDAILIGTSLSWGFDTDYIDRALNVRSLKLAMAGSYIHEQYLMARLAIKTGKVKRVIWEIAPERLKNKVISFADKKSFPLYLYDESAANDLFYLFDPYLLEVYGKYVDYFITGKYKNQRSLKTLHVLDEEILKLYSKTKVLERLNQEIAENRPFALKSIIPQAEAEKNIDTNIIALIKDNPRIRFDLYFPPSNILYHVFNYRTDRVFFYDLLELKEVFARKLAGYANAKLFDFEHIEKITFDLNNYKDFRHYSPGINKEIIDSIGRGDYLCTADNIKICNSKIIKHVQAFTMEAVKDIR